MRKMILGHFILAGLLVLSASAAGDTYLVLPDGTGDFPTIQAAINAAVDGDVIALGNGTFRGEGNQNIDYAGKAITVCSQSGNAENCIIDVEGVHDGTAHRGFYFSAAEGADSILRDLTIINGVAEGG